jgi:hypothetical protein
MLRITDDESHGCFILEPTGALTRRDIEALDERFDAYVNEKDRVPNLVIRADSFPTWADFATLGKHLRFIREHRRIVRKVAFVSDARALDVAPRIANRFISAEIRHFPADGLDDALAWISEAEAPHVTVMSGLPDDTIGISVEGVIEARDYDDVIVPLIEEKLGRYERIKFLYRIGRKFESFTPGAVWSDTRIGLKHLTRFSRIAVVSDIEWIRHAVRLFAPMVPGDLHVFRDKELGEAKAWLAA